MNSTSPISLRYFSSEPEEANAKAVRDLRSQLQAVGIESAPSEVGPVAGARGDPIALSQLLIQFLSVGAVGNLTECAASFLTRSRSARIEIERDGKRIVMEGNPKDLADLTRQVEALLE